MGVNKAKLTAGFIVAGVLMVFFGTVLVFVGPIVIDDQVEKNTMIDPKNDMSYTMWKDLPVPFFMSVYFFHVLNPEELLNGEKPMVEQRGPYVYRKSCQKENITFHPNFTVSYREFRTYHFEPSMSVGNESDLVTVPNMLVLSAAVMMEKLPFALRLLISATFKTFNEGPFLTKTVGELMWGYDSKLVDFLNQYLPGMLPASGKFGLFAEFNNSNTGLFTVNTGKDDIKKVHRVDSWNGLTELSYWRSPQCNMINGTAGQMWPPFMTTESTLPFYSPDACRSLELVYQRPGEMLGIPLYRFVAPKTMFANGSEYEPNQGFCPCRQSGLLNVSTCRHNSPVFISHPHFFNADPVLLDSVLEPHVDPICIMAAVQSHFGLSFSCQQHPVRRVFLRLLLSCWEKLFCQRRGASGAKTVISLDQNLPNICLPSVDVTRFSSRTATLFLMDPGLPQLLQEFGGRVLQFEPDPLEVPPSSLRPPAAPPPTTTTTPHS
ncbi:Scavenger receptor class B member 1 [Oryzias melastigma]|uniref:Scavenger receptor class B member 1 n=1 Tax=Oryzias melastigma TaxID=30732 RepID=A0A834BXR8_ORYME|nr:Scavenger receptor class B member 1 [Oryzias melastigma]